MSVNVVTVKAGVTFAIVTPGLVRILAALDQVARAAAVNLEITCGNEGHPPSDVHSRGLACDVSVHQLTVEQLLDVRRRLLAALPDDFTVLYERADAAPDPRLAAIAYINAGATAPHFHLQVRNGHSFPAAAAGSSTVSA